MPKLLSFTPLASAVPALVPFSASSMVATAALVVLHPLQLPVKGHSDAASLHRLEELDEDHVKQIHGGILNSRTALSAQEVLEILIAGSWESGLGKYHRVLALS